MRTISICVLTGFGRRHDLGVSGGPVGDFDLRGRAELGQQHRAGRRRPVSALCVPVYTSPHRALSVAAKGGRRDGRRPPVVDADARQDEEEEDKRHYCTYHTLKKKEKYRLNRAFAIKMSKIFWLMEMEIMTIFKYEH